MGILRKFTPNRLPAEAARALGLDVGTRVLAWSPLVGGGVAAATVDGLHVLTPQGRTLHREWAQVRRASWEAASGTLAVAWVSSRQLTPLELTAPGRLPEVVHERVRSSLLLAQEVTAPGGRSVWVALRRAADGAAVTQVVPSPGVRLDDPEVLEQVRRAEEALRDEAGSTFGIVQDADPA
jgi:hypothetical protein